MREMLVHSDARAIGIVPGMSVGGTRKTRGIDSHTSFAFDDCKCYDSNGNLIRVIPRNSRPQRKSVHTRQRQTKRDAAAEYLARLDQLGAIGNTN